MSKRVEMSIDVDDCYAVASVEHDHGRTFTSTVTVFVDICGYFLEVPVPPALERRLRDRLSAQYERMHELKGADDWEKALDR